MELIQSAIGVDATRHTLHPRPHVQQRAEGGAESIGGADVVGGKEDVRDGSTGRVVLMEQFARRADVIGDREDCLEALPTRRRAMPIGG